MCSPVINIGNGKTILHFRVGYETQLYYHQWKQNLRQMTFLFTFICYIIYYYFSLNKAQIVSIETNEPLFQVIDDPD